MKRSDKGGSEAGFYNEMPGVALSACALAGSQEGRVSFLANCSRSQHPVD